MKQMKHLVGLLLTFLTGCATQPSASLAPIAPKCKPVTELFKACHEPELVKDNITYGDLVKVHLTDRHSLQECKARHDALSLLIKDCNRIIDDYNRTINDKTK